MLKWIKLKKAYDGHAVDELIEVDDAIAKALVSAGIAEDATDEAIKALKATETSELQAAIQAMTAEIVKNFEAGTKAIEAARPNLRLEDGESEDDKKFAGGGFKSIGHFAGTVIRARRPGKPNRDAAKALGAWHDLANRVRRAATGLNESTDPDGGDLIPPQFSQQLWERQRNLTSVADEVDFMPISGNTMRIPADAETSRKDGQRRGGVQGYWEGEAAQYPSTKPQFNHRDLRLKKLTVLVYATNELLEDTGGVLEAYINRVAPEEITFKLNDALVNGNGAGTLLGIMGALAAGGPVVQVAKEAAQGAQTILAQNILKMYGRFYAPSRPKGCWCLNQDVEQGLYQMSLPTGSYSGVIAFMPAGGLSERPFATLMGMPVKVIEQCQSIGTPGDIILCDYSQYFAIKKAAGVQQAVSIHLRFDYDETVFKFTFRCDAQPSWTAPLIPKNGNVTQAPFVTLATR